MKEITHDLTHDLTFYCAINCVCHSIRSMFGVLGIYNFGYSVHSSSMYCKSILGLVDTHYDLVCRTEVFGTKRKFCQTILTLSAFVISFSVLSENKLKVHMHAVYGRKTSYFAVICFIVHTIELKSLKIGSQQSFFQLPCLSFWRHNPQ